MDPPRLIDRPQLLMGRAVRLLVVAPAGFGKTSLLKQWAMDRDVVWLTAASLPPEHAQLTTALGRALNIEGLPPEAMLPQLAGRAIVIDDAHLLLTESDRATLELLIEASDTFALAIGSRTEPNLSALHRRRVRQELTEISAEDLCFRGNALEQWTTQFLPHPLEKETLTLLEEKTGGWAAALVLVIQQLTRLPQAQWHTTVAALSAHSQTLYDYLAAELLEALPMELRHFLLENSMLVTLPLAVENGALFRELERRRLLLTNASGGFTLHTLFREFLQARLEEEIGHAAFRTHCDRQAEQLWKSGAWEEAFRLWWAQGFPERIASTIATTASARYLDYFSWVRLLPLPLLEQYPLALRLRGVAETEAKEPSAEAILLRAEELLPPSEVAEAQLARVRVYRYHNQWDSVFSLLQELAPRLLAPSALRVRLLQEWAFYYHNHSLLSQAGQTLEEASTLLQRVGGTPVQQASILVQRATMSDLWQGRFPRIHEAYQQIKALFSPEPPPVIQAFLAVLIAELAFHQNHPECTSYYQELIERAQAVGYRDLHTYGTVFLQFESVRQKKSDHAEEYLLGIEYDWLTLLIQSHLRSVRAGELEVSKPGSCLWWFFAEPLLERGERQEALRFCAIAYHAAEELGNPYAKMMARYWSALCLSNELLVHLAECLALAQAHHYEEILLWQPESERFLVLALSSGVAPATTRRLLQQKNTEVLCIRGFGGLVVESAVGVVRWHRPKAGALFALLWLAEGKPLRVERIVATLWPDATEDKGRQSYRTHCTYLRRALGEGRIVATQENLRVVLPDACFEDRRILIQAHASDEPPLWEHALTTISTGEFLPEFSAEDWAIPEREYLHRLRRELRLRLASHKLALGQPEPAVDLCRQVLQEDPLDEDALLAGTAALLVLERTSEARALLKQYSQQLQKANLAFTENALRALRKLGLAITL